MGIALYGLLSTREDRNLAARTCGRCSPPSPEKTLASVVTPGMCLRLVWPTAQPGGGVNSHRLRRRAAPTLTGGKVLLHGCRATIVGPDLHGPDPGGRDGNPRRGTRGRGFVLLGTSGQETITATTWPSSAGTITNEISSRLGPGWSADRPDNPKALLPVSSRANVPTGTATHHSAKPTSVRGRFVITRTGRGSVPFSSVFQDLVCG